MWFRFLARVLPPNLTVLTTDPVVLVAKDFLYSDVPDPADVCAGLCVKAGVLTRDLARLSWTFRICAVPVDPSSWPRQMNIALGRCEGMGVNSRSTQTWRRSGIVCSRGVLAGQQNPNCELHLF